MVWLNLTILLCILWSSNSCEPNTQIGRNPVFLNSLFCTSIPILLRCSSNPCVVRILQFKWALTELLRLQIVVKENLVWFVPLLLHRRPPKLSCSNDRRVHHSGDLLSRLSFAASDLLPTTGSHDNCITIINWADDLEDYTGPQERSHSSVSAYFMHHLIWWHATLSSWSPIRLWVRSKLMLKLEFLNGCGYILGQQSVLSVYYLVNLRCLLWVSCWVQTNTKGAIICIF